MSFPKYARRKVTIDPRLSFPPGIVDVEIDTNSDVQANDTLLTGNGYAGGITRDERPVNPNGPILPPVSNAPVTSGVNPWGVGRLVGQELIINSDGKIQVEVTFELPDNPAGYEERVARV